MVNFKLRQQSFVLGLFVAVAVALIWPLPATPGAARWAELTANLAVFLIFFSQGLSLAKDEILAGCRPFKLHVFVLGWNFILFPVLAAIISILFRHLLGSELSMGLWMLAILPTTIASATALTAASGAAVPQSIFASIFSNLLAIVCVPLLAFVYMSHSSGFEFSLLPVFSKLCWFVFLPLVFGQCLRCSFCQFAMGIRSRTRWLPQGAILYIVYLSFAGTVSSGLLETLSPGRLFGGLFAVTLLLLLASWGVWQSSKWMNLSQGERVAAFFTASQKSIATGLPLLTTILAVGSLPAETGLVLLPLLFYHPLQLLLGGFLVPRLSGCS